jgi:transcription elongation GreA/GreB family factor
VIRKSRWALCYSSFEESALLSLTAHFLAYLTQRSLSLSVAFTKEDSAETASETLLPDRPVSPHPNLVTEAGLKALEFDQAREAYETAQKIEDVNERRRQEATPLRDVRYFATRVRTAQVITKPTSTHTVAFGSRSMVTFRRDDGRVQKYRIVGEDEADLRPVLFPSYPQWQGF